MTKTLTPAQRRMLENAKRGRDPYYPKRYTGGARANLRMLQEAGLLHGHVLTLAGGEAIRTNSFSEVTK